MDAIAAVYSDWGIGCGGTQPVTVPEDRRSFAALTKGAAVIVGSRTLEDFPDGKPLKGRVNIVLTHGEAPEGAVRAGSAAEALAEAKKYPRCFIIGGASVYAQLLKYADRAYITKLDCRPRSDVFFPNLDSSPDWRLESQSEPMISENGTGYRFAVYRRLS